jgi:crotonobetainyl-CoA:carnitine CoA-transferase CaiB-like acyl-CoA transferase
MAGPLDGIRIIDMTTVILGPYATQILGDLGADVIKVESPEGDSSRHVNPGRHRGMAGTAMNLHRNKRSIVLDLKRDKGKDVLLRLAETADALIHNIRPPAIARLGLTYEAVRARNPDIVYCSFTGYGRAGPNAGRPAYDDLIQGASGIAGLLARAQGEPAYFPGTICDKITGLTGVYAVLAALLHRERTGEAQEIEVPMLETMVSFNLVEQICDAVFDPPLAEMGYPRMLSPNRRPYRTADGYLCVLPYTDRQWRDFFEVAGRADLIDDERYAELSERTERVDEMYAIIAGLLPTKTTAEWEEIFAAHSIPAMPVADLDDLLEDEHLTAARFFEPRHHPSEGSYRAIGIPTWFSNSPASIRRDAPRQGEHGAEILREVGYSADEIAGLARDGVTKSIR